MTERTERELLEAAARAAGIEVYAYQREAHECWGEYPSCLMVDGIEWNPLTDDGDALRLAVRLLLGIEHSDPRGQDSWVSAIPLDKMVGPMEDVDGESYRLAATRRAIVRAAASMAKKD